MEREFTERELSDFSGFGELPEDLRNTGPISMPDGSFITPTEGDVFGLAVGTGGLGAPVSYGESAGGAERLFMEPIPPGTGSTQINWSAINYLPRGNFESFRSQRFFGGGRAYLPPDPTTFVSLMVDPASLPPGSPVTESGGLLTVPAGYAGIITGIRQWIGDPNAFNKPNGAIDDIIWRVTTSSTPIYSQGNFPFMMSSSSMEAKEYAIVNEGASIAVEVMNRMSSSDPQARSIAVSAIITGHWFPMDEVDDIFRNK